MYPNQAPNFRFITVPYHINISCDGKICMNSFVKGYMTSKHVIDIIQEIKELFMIADVNSPVRLDAFNLFLNHREEYEKRANDSSKNAKDDYNEYSGSSLVIDEFY